MLNKKSWPNLFRPLEDLYSIAWLIFQPLRWSGLLRVKGLEKIPQFREKRGVVVIAKHESPIDSWKISAVLPRSWRLIWLATKELFDCEQAIGKFLNWPVVFSSRIPWIVEKSGAIPVDGDDPGSRYNRFSLKKAINVLKRGGVLGLFPEGTFREEEKKVRDVSLTFLAIAKKTQSIILLVAIDGNQVNIIEVVYPESLVGDREAEIMMEKIGVRVTSRGDSDEK